MHNLNSLRKDRAHFLDRMEALVVASEARSNKQMTPTELMEFDSAERQCRLLGSQIQQAEQTWRAAGIDAGSSHLPAMLACGFGGAQSTTGPFETLGQQLSALVDAGRDGGRVDPRLHEVRAASGMAESPPDSGGLQSKPTFRRNCSLRRSRRASWPRAACRFRLAQTPAASTCRVSMKPPARPAAAAGA